MNPSKLLAAALTAGTLTLAPHADANSWAELAAAATQAQPDAQKYRSNQRDSEKRGNRGRHGDHHRHPRFDHRHHNVRRAMRRHGISRWDHPVWTGSGFRIAGYTAHGLVDIVFGYPNYAVHSAAHRRHHARDRYWNDWRDRPRHGDGYGYGGDYRPHHYNRRPLKERRVRRIAARRYGMDVYRARCVKGRWILIGHRHGHRHGRYKLVLDAFSGHELAFHRIRGHR